MKPIELLVCNTGNIIFIFIALISYLDTKSKIPLGIMIILFASAIINMLVIEFADDGK